MAFLYDMSTLRSLVLSAFALVGGGLSSGCDSKEGHRSPLEQRVTQERPPEPRPIDTPDTVSGSAKLPTAYTPYRHTPYDKYPVKPVSGIRIRRYDPPTEIERRINHAAEIEIIIKGSAPPLRPGGLVGRHADIVVYVPSGYTVYPPENIPHGYVQHISPQPVGGLIPFGLRYTGKSNTIRGKWRITSDRAPEVISIRVGAFVILE